MPDRALSWKDVKYFKASEFDSPDAPGSGEKGMNLEFVHKMDMLRAACGFPLFITSGYRTTAHNAKVGGVDSSAHTTGHAADIRAGASSTKFAIVDAALAIGFKRIGVGATFVHVDDAPGLPDRVLWTY